MPSRLNKIIAITLLLTSGISQAQVSLYAVRVEAADSDALEDNTTHIIFGVDNAVAIAAAVEAAGGTIERAPFAYGNDGMMIGMVMDPAGNHVELIQKPK